jgi:uncharacterized protein (DUF2164 family)
LAVTIALLKQTRERAILSIRQYFDENMDEEIGDLKAGLLLDYFLVEIGPSIYNRAIADAQTFFQEKVADLEGACYEPEFEYRSKP